MLKKEYNAAKTISMLLVVFGHAQVFSFGHAVWLFPMNVFRTQLDSAISFLYCFHVHLFFFVSGALFKTTEKTQISSNVISFVEKKAIRLLVPYFACFIFLLLPVRVLVGYYPANLLVSIKQVFCELIGFGDNGHLWFLPTLFIDYVLFYCIGRICNRRTIGILSSVIALYSLSYIIPDRFDTSIRYLWWFMAGYFFDMICYERLTRVKSNVLFSTSIVCLSGAYLLYNAGKKIQDMRAFPLTMLVTLLGLFGIVFLAYICARRQAQLLSFLEENSYSIYLFHDPVNYLFLLLIGKFISISALSEAQYVVILFMKVVMSLLGAILIKELGECAKKQYHRMASSLRLY